jgi:hypothetical protein
MQLALEDQQDGGRQQHGGEQNGKSWFHVTSIFRGRAIFRADMPGDIRLNMTAA